MRVDLLGLDFAAFSAWLKETVGFDARFHAAAYRDLMADGRWDPDQVPLWRQRTGAEDLLPRLRALAAADQAPAEARRLEAVDDDLGRTVKLQLTLADGAQVESVLIPMAGGAHHTVCVSSQVGCRMGCTFCLTAKMGLVRNLTAHEIVGQVVASARVLGRPPRNVVFMGMGEPLDNLPAVAQAIRVLGDRHGLALAQRHITVSTVGRADILPRLAEEGLSRINLAVSLTVADDIKRSRLMPINRRHDVAELKRALAALPLPRGRRIMVSCALIAGLNDGAEDREALVAWCRDLPVLVNLIPFNPIPGSDWRRPDETSLHAFRDHLDRAGIPVRLRATRGDAVLAACGQLGRSRDRRDRAR